MRARILCAFLCAFPEKQAKYRLEQRAQARLLQAAEGLCRLAPELLRETGPERALASPEEAILAHVRAHGRITRREAITLTGLSEEQARYRLRKLTEQGRLEPVGAGRGAYYRLPQTEENGE